VHFCFTGSFSAFNNYMLLFAWLFMAAAEGCEEQLRAQFGPWMPIKDV